LTLGPRRKPRPLVLLCDISGSMAPYTRMLLHFLHTLRHGVDRAEVFVFGTRLTRITHQQTLTRLGARYRLHRKDLPGNPDIVMPGRRLAIFVHGCSWHGHDCPRGARVPKQNRDYWLGKVERNRARDIASRTALESQGWWV